MAEGLSRDTFPFFYRKETGMRVVSECVFAVRITGRLLVSIATIRVIEQLKLA